MFGCKRKCCEDTIEGWTDVDHMLPPNDIEVMAIGRRYCFSAISVGLSSFCKNTGWNGDVSIVYAWKQKPALLEALRHAYPKKE